MYVQTFRSYITVVFILPLLKVNCYLLTHHFESYLTVTVNCKKFAVNHYTNIDNF